MTARETAIVTGCDRRYLPLLLDLLANLADLGVADRATIYVFDIDFTAEDRAGLAGYPVEVRRLAREPIAIAHPDPLGRHVVSTVRPVLPTVFPGHRSYVYLDVDTWLVDAAVLDAYVAAAAGGGLALALATHPAYPTPADDWRPFHRRFYPEAVAERMGERPAWNGGIVAGAGASPAWRAWEDEMRRVVDRTGNWFGAAQSALVYLEMTGALTIASLPAECNWTVHRAVPRWDRAKRALVTPAPAYAPLRLVHLTGPTKTALLRIAATDRNGFLSGLRYPDFLRLKAGTATPDTLARRVHLRLAGRAVLPQGRMLRGLRRIRRAMRKVRNRKAR